MTWWNPDSFKEQKPRLQTRMELIKAVRNFFDEKDFWEVETPILQAMPTADTHIHGFKTDLHEPHLQKQRELYLHTSPEFAMKKLMVAGVSNLYQICHVFRNGESTRLHSPEFTMIEWYRAHATYETLMDDCEALLCHCAQRLSIEAYKHKGHTSNPFEKWQRISVCEAFKQLADIDLQPCLDDRKAFANAAEGQGIRITENDAWDDIFHAIMAEKIEPHLGMGVPTILYDYPISMASLSRKKPTDPRFAERFELYVCGIELANAFSELTDAKEQRQRFIEAMDAKEALYGTRYPIDEEFLEALEHGLPESTGIALGIDRLVMLATDADDIEQVLWTGKP